MDVQFPSPNPDKYPAINQDCTKLICYVMIHSELRENIIPETLLNSNISWYHQTILHIGITRLYNTILYYTNSVLHRPSLKKRIET